MSKQEAVSLGPRPHSANFSTKNRQLTHAQLHFDTLLTGHSSPQRTAQSISILIVPE
jgi:hypothetical protein